MNNNNHNNNQKEQKELNQDQDQEKTKEEQAEPDISELFEFDSPEDFQRFLNEVTSNEKAKKRQVIGFSNRLVKNFFLNFLLLFAINTVLILAIDGYLELIKHEKLLSLLYFSGLFTLVDITLREIIYRYYPVLIFMTLGIILMVSFVIALIIPLLIIQDIDFGSVSSFIFFFLIFSIIRTLIMQYYIQRKRFKKIRFKK
ncbi:MAG: hypothetical protein PHG08_04610 [Bacilli bacterium]|jgi:uncharacterized membrane protein YvlD (DUF360 family)|nr:hypothetical protein [Bacilli bacterium]HHU24038.1 hypothetical protein [Acholeplasmataceae bacterium]